MNYREREAELEEIFYNYRMELIDLSNTAVMNKQIVLRLSCLVWEFKQKYRTNSRFYYVSQKEYKADYERIVAQEKRLVWDGDYEDEAALAIKQAKEYLELIAGYRVRKPDRNRVF